MHYISKLGNNECAFLFCYLLLIFLYFFHLYGPMISFSLTFTYVCTLKKKASSLPALGQRRWGGKGPLGWRGASSLHLCSNLYVDGSLGIGRYFSVRFTTRFNNTFSSLAIESFRCISIEIFFLFEIWFNTFSFFFLFLSFSFSFFIFNILLQTFLLGC